MRILFSGLLAAGLLTSQLAMAAEPCARPADKAAFDVAGLKSELMVTALTCSASEKYNAFVTRYRADLGQQERALNGYFSRSYGRRGQSQHDDYITNLANVQSEAGLKLGTSFCQQNIGLFDEVMALKTGSELATLAQAKNVAQPLTLVDCPAGPVRATVHEASARSTPTKHH